MARERDDRRGRDDERGRDRGRDREDDRRGNGRDRERERGGDRGGGRGGRVSAAHRTADNVRARSERRGGGFEIPFKNGFDTWRAKEGENCIRILPPTWDEPSHYAYQVWMHTYIGATNSTYICPKKTSGKPCAACDEAAALKVAGEDEDAKELAVRERWVCWVIDRDDRKPSPKLFVMSFQQDRDVSEASVIKRTNTTLYIDGEEDGYDLFVKRTGKGLMTRYNFVVDRDSSAISDDDRELDEILKYIEDNPIPTVLVYHDNKVIAADLEGMTKARDRDLDEGDERPARRRGRDRDDDALPPRRGRDRNEEEEEEDTTSRRGERVGRGRDRDELPWKDDEPPPRRGRHDSDEQDEEDDPPPRRGRDRAADDDPPPRRGRDRDAEDEPPPRRGRDREDEPPRRVMRDARNERDRPRDRDDERPRTRH